MATVKTICLSRPPVARLLGWLTLAKEPCAVHRNQQRAERESVVDDVQ